MAFSCGKEVARSLAYAIDKVLRPLPETPAREIAAAANALSQQLWWDHALEDPVRTESTATFPTVLQAETILSSIATTHASPCPRKSKDDSGRPALHDRNIRIAQTLTGPWPLSRPCKPSTGSRLNHQCCE